MTDSKNIALSVRNLTKEYPFQDGILKALDDISFDLYEGEILGVIGRNGAGKSTLLKVLSEITSPTKGIIEYEGRLTSIIEIGTGFHADLSGKENVFLSASILGHSRSKTKAIYDSIVEFSGLDGFMNTPVKHYSSGMFLRLAFSVAFHLEIDILLLDEVLAVGDREFRMKCYSKIEELRDQGVAIILISHNMESIIEFCDRAFFLEKGKIESKGSPMDVVDYYTRFSDSSLDKEILAKRSFQIEEKSFYQIFTEVIKVDDIILEKVSLSVKNQRNFEMIFPSDQVSIDFDLHKDSNKGSLEIMFYLINTAGHRVLMDSIAYRNYYKIVDLKRGNYKYSCDLPKDLLSAGIYSICLMIAKDRVLVSDLGAVAKFRVESEENGLNDRSMGSIVRPKLNWRVTKRDI